MTMASTVGSVTDPPGRWRALAALATTMVFAMSTWFSTAAAMSSLREELDLGETMSRGLVVAVQLGFVVGALTSAVLSLADRITPRALSASGALVVAVVNLAPALVTTPATLLASRFLVGLTIAVVCPPLLSAMSTWFRTGRGVALGVMVGALTLGSAAPHLVNGVGSPGWRTVLVVTSALALAAAAIVRWGTVDGPYRTPATGFDPSRIVSLMRNRGVRLAYAGYLGHMWELYAGWAAMAIYLRQVLGGNGRAAAIATFCVIGVGAAGSVVGGVLGDRGGKARAARISLLWSGALVAILGLAVDWPTPLVMALALAWGFWVIADSAQLTALVTEHADADQDGTAVTIQLAGGFALTAATMWLVPVVHDAVGWGRALARLAPGPLLAAIAMGRLERSPRAEVRTLHRRPIPVPVCVAC
jgi:MFS family permease